MNVAMITSAISVLTTVVSTFLTPGENGEAPVVTVVKRVEDLMGPGNGAAKEQAAHDLLEAAAGLAGVPPSSFSTYWPMIRVGLRAAVSGLNAMGVFKRSTPIATAATGGAAAVASG